MPVLYLHHAEFHESPQHCTFHERDGEWRVDPTLIPRYHVRWHEPHRLLSVPVQSRVVVSFELIVVDGFEVGKTLILCHLGIFQQRLHNITHLYILSH